MSPAETENMAKATRMGSAELASALRVIARIQDDDALAKWVLGVAAERLECGGRKVISIATMGFSSGPNNGECHKLVVLCEDGTLWEQWHSMGYANVPADGAWHQLSSPNDRDEPTLGRAEANKPKKENV